MSSLDITWLVVVFVGAAAVIGSAGWKLTGLADRLADRTGMGEAVAGALFLGATTSLPGTVTSVTAAGLGLPDLAISNAIGGIVAQMAFLSIADLTYRHANLEHAAASTGNLLAAGLLVVMLSIPLVASLLPEVTLWGVHPATLLLPGVYLWGIRLIRRARREPMWRPHRTPDTREDTPAPQARHLPLPRLIGELVVLGTLVGVAGWTLARVGAELTTRTGLSSTAVGGVFTAVSSSLPELITSVAAVRQGALTLAVGGIIGGNAFDVIFLSGADLAYRRGSIYHQITSDHLLLIAVSLLMTGIFTMGLVAREKRGIAGIGFESFLVLVLYLGTVAALFL